MLTAIMLSIIMQSVVVLCATPKTIVVPKFKLFQIQLSYFCLLQYTICELQTHQMTMTKLYIKLVQKQSKIDESTRLNLNLFGALETFSIPALKLKIIFLLLVVEFQGGRNSGRACTIILLFQQWWVYRSQPFSAQSEA